MDSLDEHVLEIYRLAQDCPLEEFRGCVFSVLSGKISFDSARWGSGSMASSGIATRFTHLHNEPPEMLAAYEEVKSQDHMVTALWKRNGHFTLRVHAATHYGAPQYRDIREYQRRFRHENSLIVTHIRAEDRRTEFISLYRADEQAHFDANEHRMMKKLWPHLLEAQRIKGLLHARDITPRARRTDSHLGIADCMGAILHTTPQINDLLSEEWPSMRKARLPSALANALASSGKFDGHCVHVTARMMQGMLFFRVRRHCPADGLSPRELEIARTIAQGATHREAALKLSINPETVRSHLRHIHDKLGVRNRAELVAELARIR